MQSWDVVKPGDNDLVKDFPILHRTEKNQMGNLLGIPSNTTIANPMFETDANGLISLLLQTAGVAGAPTIPGQIRRLLEKLLYHDGERVVDICPIGIIVPFAGSASVVPVGWRLCDGTAISRTTFAALFAIIGTTYGVGDGTTTFNLPNLIGRTVIGIDPAEPLLDTLGELGGAKTDTPVFTGNPQANHNHGLANHNHGLSGHGHLLSSGAPIEGTISPTPIIIDGDGLLRPMTLGGTAIFRSPVTQQTGGPSVTTTEGPNPNASDLSTIATPSGSISTIPTLPPYQVTNWIIRV